MSVLPIKSGDVIRCTACGHTRDVTDKWLREINRKLAVTPDRDALERFRCSRCGKKSLSIFGGAPSRGLVATERQVVGQDLAKALVAQASPSEQQLLLTWAQHMLVIRNSNASSLDKAKQAIAATVASKAIWPFIRTIGSEIKRVGWDERSLPAKMGLSAAALAAVVFSGKAAGLAALGGAIAVPMWIVFGAGAAFAGVLIEEVGRGRTPDGTGNVIEGVAKREQ